MNSEAYQDDRYQDLSPEGPSISHKQIMDENAITIIKRGTGKKAFHYYKPKQEANSDKVFYKFWGRPVLELKEDCIGGGNGKFKSKKDLMANIDS